LLVKLIRNIQLCYFSLYFITPYRLKPPPLQATPLTSSSSNPPVMLDISGTFCPLVYINGAALGILVFKHVSKCLSHSFWLILIVILISIIPSSHILITSTFREKILQFCKAYGSQVSPIFILMFMWQALYLCMGHRKPVWNNGDKIWWILIVISMSPCPCRKILHISQSYGCQFPENIFTEGLGLTANSTCSVRCSQKPLLWLSSV